jgi:hypothetical protein
MKENQQNIPSVANPSIETVQTDPNVLELIDLVSTDDFLNKLIAVQTKAESSLINRLLQIKKNKKLPDYDSRLAEAREALDRGIAHNTKIIEKLREELKHPNPQLNSALNAWGRSRNKKGEIGLEDRGFNAGVIHYFEYRTSIRKNRNRFKAEHELSVDGFISHTKEYQSFLNNPSPAHNPQVEIARLLEDEKGNRRLYILTKDGDFIVGFQKTGQPMKILSVYLDQTAQKLNKTAEEALHPTERSKSRFNYLEGSVKEMSI